MPLPNDKRWCDTVPYTTELWFSPLSIIGTGLQAVTAKSSSFHLLSLIPRVSHTASGLQTDDGVHQFRLS